MVDPNKLLVQLLLYFIIFIRLPDTNRTLTQYQSNIYGTGHYYLTWLSSFDYEKILIIVFFFYESCRVEHAIVLKTYIVLHLVMPRPTYLDTNTRRLRPIRVASKTKRRGPLNFGPCKTDWPAAFVSKIRGRL